MTVAGVARSVSRIAYGGVSILLLLGYDIGSVGMDSVARSTTRSVGLLSRPLTVVLHCTILASVVQTRVGPGAMDMHAIMFRSYAFICLSMIWIYAVGIPDMVTLLANTTRRPTIELKGHPSSENRMIVISTCIVQSFLPCQLRFACILFCDGWTAYTLAGAMFAIVSYRMYLLGSKASACCLACRRARRAAS